MQVDCSILLMCIVLRSYIAYLDWNLGINEDFLDECSTQSERQFKKRPIKQGRHITLYSFFQALHFITYYLFSWTACDKQCIHHLIYV